MENVILKQGLVNDPKGSEFYKGKINEMYVTVSYVPHNGVEHVQINKAFVEGEIGFTVFNGRPETPDDLETVFRTIN